MHPHDVNCRWCGFGPLFRIVDGFRCGTYHECPRKPPLTPDEGAAALGGLIGMATAIKERPLYWWKLCIFWGGSKNHAVSFCSSEELAKERAAKMSKLGDRVVITKEENDWCPYCKGTGDLQWRV